jgi:hypothetical protein
MGLEICCICFAVPAVPGINQLTWNGERERNGDAVGNLPMNANKINVAICTCVEEVLEPRQTNVLAFDISDGRGTEIHLLFELLSGFHVCFPSYDGIGNADT